MPTPRSNEEWQEFWQDCYREAKVSPRDMLLSFARSFPTWKGHQTIRLINYTCEEIMARGKNANNQPPANNRFGSTEFVDIPVLESDWTDVQKVYGSAEVLVDATTDLLNSGYRVGLSFNPNNDAFICSVTCRQDGDVNNGLTFNAFAETWFEALQLAMFKHYVKSRKVWRKPGEKPNRPKFG